LERRRCGADRKDIVVAGATTADRVHDLASGRQIAVLEGIKIGLIASPSRRTVERTRRLGRLGQFDPFTDLASGRQIAVLEAMKAWS
jgi:hypothetical protein